MIYEFGIGSHWIFVEKVLPHVELLVGEGWNGDLEADYQVASVALLV